MPPPSLLEEDRARLRECFVGRTEELRSLQRLLGDEAGAPSVILLHGPGGIGKTALLMRLVDLAEAAGVDVRFLDARDLERTPRTLASVFDDSGFVARSDDDRPHLFLLDTAELLAPVEARLRDEILRRASRRSRIVVAGRDAPTAGWRTLPSFGGAIQAIALQPLAPEQAREYLRRRDVDDARGESIARFAAGYPLALVLAAEANRRAPEQSLEPESHTDLVRDLCERFVADLPDEAHWAAIEAASVLRFTTEEMLSALYPQHPMRQPFQWLRKLGFVDVTRQGVYPHDLVREVIGRDFRWRRPGAYADLIARALRILAARVATAPRDQFFGLMAQVAFLLRENPRLASVYTVPPGLDVDIAPAHEQDLPAARAIVEKHEGPESVAVFDYWWSRQPDAFRVVRDAAREVVGVSTVLRLDRMTAEDARVDPGVAPVLAHARTLLGDGPPHAAFIRLVAARDEYQTPSPLVAACGIATAEPVFRHHFKLMYHYHADLAQWRELVEMFGGRWLQSARFELGGHEYHVALNDYRQQSAADWLVATAAQEFAKPEPAPPSSTRTSQSVELDHDAFTEAVRAALRALHNPRRLSSSALIDTRLIRASAPPQATVQQLGATLRQLLLDEIESLRGKSKGDRLHQAIHSSYVRPAESQELAADAAGVSYSTFRRHLSDAVDRVALALWERELSCRGSRRAPP